MRKILFRGKRMDDGKWILGSLIKANIRNATAWIIFKPDFVFTSEGVKSMGHAHVDPETVGQCTGLKDMNGKWIFEGDIVQIGEENGKIEYSETEAMFQVVFDVWCTDFDHYFGTDFEVIGNIHDNPELLEDNHEVH